VRQTRQTRRGDTGPDAAGIAALGARDPRTRIVG